MYTELNCALKLIPATPTQVVDTLLFMTGQSSVEPAHHEPHSLFEDTQWSTMLQGSSTYFDGHSHAIVRFDESSGAYRVTIRCNFKNSSRSSSTGSRPISTRSPEISWVTRDTKILRYRRCSITRGSSSRPISRKNFSPPFAWALRQTQRTTHDAPCSVLTFSESSRGWW